MENAEAWRSIDWDQHLGAIEVEGRRVSFVDYGEGPPVLLVHGMAGSWETWLANLPGLADNHRLVAVDLPGFGGSDPLPNDDDFAGYLRTLEALLDVLGIPSVALVGHSLGGLVALSFAVQQPQRVRCLVLVSGGGVDLSSARLRAIRVVFGLLAAVLMIPGAYRVLTSSAVIRIITRSAIHAGGSVPVDLLRRMMPKRVGPGFIYAVSRGSAQLAVLDLRRVAAPALLVWGRHDRILPVSAGERLHRSLPQSTLVVLQAAGHCANFEQPDEFLRLATNFLGAQMVDRDGSAAGRASARSWTAPRVDVDATHRYGDGNAG